MSKRGQEILLDRKRALEHVQGDEEFLNEIYQIFLEEIPGRVEQFQEALRGGDIDAVIGLAHSLKGVSLTIGAISCHKTAERLEMAARDGDEKRVREIFEDINVILGELESTLSAMEL